MRRHFHENKNQGGLLITNLLSKKYIKNREKEGRKPLGRGGCDDR